MSQFLASLFPPLPEPISGVLQSILQVWGAVWWIALPLITGFIFWEWYLLFLHVRFLSRIKWKVLEIKIPKNVLKTPKAMEQIFAAAHTPFSYGYNWYQKYVQGRDEEFFSFEIVARAGETHFYLRTSDHFRHVMESAIYGQYPEAQITEVEDYLDGMPHVLPNKDFDVAGFEEILRGSNCFPIRTYPSFEEPVEEHRVDPIASLIEGMSKMEGDQQFWFQLIVVPAGEEFREEGQRTINKMLGIEEKKERGPSILPNFDLGLSMGDIVASPFKHPGTEVKEKKREDRDKTMRFLLSPHDKEVAEAIQKKISKLAFEVTPRFLFIERRGETPAGIDKTVFLAHGYVRQFNTTNLNQLRPDKETTTASYAVHGLFRKMRLRWRKRVMYERYQHLVHNRHKPVLNIEELATIYHFPTGTVSTTELEKVESRKGTAPAALPIIEE